MSFKPNLEEVKKEAKSFIDQNVWDGDDRSGAEGDCMQETPDSLQELIDELLEHLRDQRFI